MEEKENRELREVGVVWKTETLIVWVKWFKVWVSIYIKAKVNWFFTFETGLSMGSWWVLISQLPVSILKSGKKTQTHTQSKRENP